MARPKAAGGPVPAVWQPSSEGEWREEAGGGAQGQEPGAAQEEEDERVGAALSILHATCKASPPNGPDHAMEEPAPFATIPKHVPAMRPRSHVSSLPPEHDWGPGAALRKAAPAFAPAPKAPRPVAPRAPGGGGVPPPGPLRTLLPRLPSLASQAMRPPMRAAPRAVAPPDAPWEVPTEEAHVDEYLDEEPPPLDDAAESHLEAAAPPAWGVEGAQEAEEWVSSAPAGEEADAWGGNSAGVGTEAADAGLDAAPEELPDWRELPEPEALEELPEPDEAGQADGQEPSEDRRPPEHDGASQRPGSRPPQKQPWSKGGSGWPQEPPEKRPRQQWSESTWAPQRQQEQQSRQGWTERRRWPEDGQRWSGKPWEASQGDRWAAEAGWSGNGSHSGAPDPKRRRR